MECTCAIFRRYIAFLGRTKIQVREHHSCCCYLRCCYWWYLSRYCCYYLSRYWYYLSRFCFYLLRYCYCCYSLSETGNQLLLGSRAEGADEVLAEGLDVARFRGDPLFARERLEVLGELLELLPWLLASAWRWSCFPRLPATAWRWSFSPVFWWAPGGARTRSAGRRLEVLGCLHIILNHHCFRCTKKSTQVS
jgi:hypothetical protein